MQTIIQREYITGEPTIAEMELGSRLLTIGLGGARSVIQAQLY